MKISRSCLCCKHYVYEEIGDSDYGAIYSDVATCEEFNDTDENEELIDGFDYEQDRSCCIPDFFKVLEVDKELGEMFEIEMSETDGISFDRTYKRFEQKYF